MIKRNGKSKPGNADLGSARAVGYVRCSTEEQTRGDYNTLESQKDYISGYIQAVHPEWELVRFSRMEDTPVRTPTDRGFRG